LHFDEMGGACNYVLTYIMCQGWQCKLNAENIRVIYKYISFNYSLFN